MQSTLKASSATDTMMSSSKLPKIGGSHKRKKEDQQEEFDTSPYPHHHHEEGDDSVNGAVGAAGDQDEEEEFDGERGSLNNKSNKKKKGIDGRETKEPALSLHAIRNMLQTPREENRPSTTSFIVDGVDITQKHTAWQHETRILTPYNRNSAWWIAYHQGTILDGDTFKAIGVCNACGNILQLGARSGTSSLTRHLASKHPNVHKAILVALKEGLMLSRYYDPTDDMGIGSVRKPPPSRAVEGKSDDPVGGTSKRPKPPPATTARMQKEFAASAIAARCLDAHVLYAADQNRSFEEFDDPSFFELRRTIAETALACARGRVGQGTINLYQLDSTAIRNRALVMANEIKAKVNQMICIQKAPIVGALHHWNGRSMQANSEGYKYNAFMIHWIQNFSRMSCCIAADVDKISSVSDWKSKLLPWKMGTSDENSPKYIVTDSGGIEGENHIECLDQKLQKVAAVAFGALLDPDDDGTGKPLGTEVLVVARQMSDYFVENDSAKESLIAKQRVFSPNMPDPGLIRDLGCQWWSTAVMIARLVEHREAVTACCTDLLEFPIRSLSEIEWNTLICLHTVLSPILETINTLKEEKDNVSSPLVAVICFEIRERLQSLSQEGGETLGVMATKDIATRMLEKLSEVAGNFMQDPFACNGLESVFIFGHALDPRFKKLKLFERDTRETIWKRLLEEMVELRPATEDTDIKKDSKEASHGSIKAEEIRSGLGAYAALDSSDDEDATGNKTQDAWKAACDVELSGFKLEKGTKFGSSDDPDTLSWWSERVWRFPTLWKLCQVYFAIPATAVPANRAFDFNGNLTTHKRCALITASPTNDALHCIHENKWVLSTPVDLTEAAQSKSATLDLAET